MYAWLILQVFLLMAITTIVVHISSYRWRCEMFWYEPRQWIIFNSSELISSTMHNVNNHYYYSYEQHIESTG